MQGIVSINITTNGNILLNKNGVPILFYCNSPGDVKEAILENEKFQEYLNREVFTLKNYSDSKISYSFYKNIDGEDIYEQNTVEIEDWKTLEELPELANQYIKEVLNKLSYILDIHPVWSDVFENDITNIYNSIDKKYPGKFSKLTYRYYIEHELQKYDLKDHNYKFLINKIKYE